MHENEATYFGGQVGRLDGGELPDGCSGGGWVRNNLIKNVDNLLEQRRHELHDAAEATETVCRTVQQVNHLLQQSGHSFDDFYEWAECRRRGHCGVVARDLRKNARETIKYRRDFAALVSEIFLSTCDTAKTASNATTKMVFISSSFLSFFSSKGIPLFATSGMS